jgi:kinesin family protein 2/24
MGNNESNPIRNMDKRTARREYRRDFMRAIADYRRHHINEEVQRKGSDYQPIVWGDTQSVRVCVRKRPIFSHEIKDSEFDVISVLEGRTAVVHDARMHIDMKGQFMNHHEFDFDDAFDENTNNMEVYDSAVSELVRHVTLEGGYGTCLVYGQTGKAETKRG